MKLYEKQNSYIRIANYSLYQLATSSLTLIVMAIVTLSLYSYNAKDSSWFFVRSKAAKPHNIFGRFGANLAGLLMYFFGSASFIIPIGLGFIAYFFAAGIEWRKELDRCMALVVLLLSTSALLASYCLDPFYAVPGGVIGSFIYQTLSRYVDQTLVFAGLHMLVFTNIVLLTRLAGVGPMRKVGRSTKHLINQKNITRAQNALIALCGYIYALVTTLVLFVITGLTRLWKFISGKLIEEQREIVSLEFGEVVEQVVQDTTDVHFWHKVQGKPAPETELFDPALSSAKQEVLQPKHSPQCEHKRHAQHCLKQAPVAQSTPLPVQEQEKSTYVMPNPADFKGPVQQKPSADDTALQEVRARTLEQKLARFGITGTVTAIKPGPVITLFEYEPDIDSKVSKILALEDDLALALEAVSIRIIAPIPGRSVVGFEVANKDRATVPLASIIRSKSYAQFGGVLPLVLGADIIGNPVIVDLADMPHLLVAGSTGSGKSVALNTMLVSLLYRCNPEQLRLILIDPKRLEFASYADIGHLIFPIVTDPRTASPVLQWVVRTMEDRYEAMAAVGVRNHQGYQKLCAERTELEPMPYIVVMIDELSDLMMTAGKEVEALIARIAQMARAAGIHMIVATQRPSVDVITGLIKVNFPSRISFRVTSKVDSRTILDCVGAEKLLGKGDMLFMSASSSLMRVHGAFVGHSEVSTLVEYIRAQQPVQYLDIQEELPLKKGSLLDADDTLYEEVLGFVKSTDQISISLLQRRFRIGYNRSARIMETLEAEGLIMPSDGSKMRKVIK